MYLGDIRLGETLDFKFTSRRFSTGTPFTLAGSPVISAYVGNGTTEITAGITLTVDFDSRTGTNNVRVVATSGNGFATATNVQLVITTGTVDSVSVVGEVVGTFSIENRSALMPTTPGRTAVVDAAGLVDGNTKKWNDLTTVALPLIPTSAGRTLDVTAAGNAGIDWGNVETPGSTVGLSATTVGIVTSLAANAIGAASIADGAYSGVAIGSIGTGGIAAASFAANAINAAALATDAVTEIQSGLATPTNITAGTITTVTNLTNLPAITANWLTAAGIATDAFTAAKFAASSLNGKGDWNVGKTGYTLTATTGLGNQTANITGTLSGTVGGIAGTITTLDALDTAQDSQHGTTQTSVSAIQTILTGITSLGNWLRRMARKDAGSAGMIAAEAEIDTGGTSTFDGTTDSQEAIRDATGGGSGTESDLLVNTTIATLTSQTVFTLTTASADNNAYRYGIAIITDAVTSTQKSAGPVTAYVGSTKTVTLESAPVFTIAVGDGIAIIAGAGLNATLDTLGLAAALNNSMTESGSMLIVEGMTYGSGMMTAHSFTVSKDYSAYDSVVLRLWRDNEDGSQTLVKTITATVASAVSITLNWTATFSSVAIVYAGCPAFEALRYSLVGIEGAASEQITSGAAYVYPSPAV